MEDGVDLLSLFMQSPDVFTEDLIVDEMFDFFLAGQVTTQYASQTLIAHAAKDPECLRKIREEFAKVMAQQPEAESGKRSKREVMDIALDTETIGDLEYLHNCMNEALRVQCPVAGRLTCGLLKTLSSVESHSERETGSLFPLMPFIWTVINGRSPSSSSQKDGTVTTLSA